MELDFMFRLNDMLNALGLYAGSSIGLLDVDESISIMNMPGGAEVEYMDGSRDKDYQVQVNAKSRNQLQCINALTTSYQELERLEDLPSLNDSYTFNKITTASLPSLVQQDEEGFFIFALSITAKITIYEGVV